MKVLAVNYSNEGETTLVVYNPNAKAIISKTIRDEEDWPPSLWRAYKTWLQK